LGRSNCKKLREQEAEWVLEQLAKDDGDEFIEALKKEVSASIMSVKKMASISIWGVPSGNRRKKTSP
jgi:hypothetical protein